MIKRIVGVILALLAVVVAPAVVLSGATYASGTHFVIRPVTVFLDLNSGETIERTLTIENAGEDVLNYKVYASSYGVADQTGDAVFNENTKYTNLKDWITFYNGSTYEKTLEGALEAGKTQEVAYRIDVPENPPAAGQYASIFVESVDKTVATDTSTVKANTRIALTLIGKTDAAAVKTAEVVQNEIPEFVPGGDIRTVFAVQNSGNVHIDAIQTLKVEGLFGGLLYENETPKIVMPERTLMAETTWGDTPEMGVFKVTSSILVNGETTEAAATVVVMPMYMIAIMVILVAAIVTIIVILCVRKRKKHTKSTKSKPRQAKP